MPKPAAVTGVWKDLRSTAASEGRSVFEVSSLLAVSAVSELPEVLERELLAELERGELKLESVLVYYRMGQLLDTVNEALRTIIQEFEDPSGEIRPAARLGGSMRPA